MTAYIMIPARYQSSRLPGKALSDLEGKSLIQRVYEAAQKTKINNIIVATDDVRIASCVKNFGGSVCMTSTKPNSGTERIAEAIENLALTDNDIIINVQGDECFVPPELINQLLDDLEQHPHIQISTLCESITTLEEIFNPNITKVVMDKDSFALYFSRAAIPWDRESFAKEKRSLPENYICYRHIGIYGYRVGLIKRYVRLKPSPLEHIEMLEQLRLLWHGEKIHVLITNAKVGPGIDTPADLELARKLIKQQ